MRAGLTIVRRSALLVALASALAVAACHSSPAVRAGAPSSSIGSCPVSAMLVPSCGVLWGIATRPQTEPALSAAERQVGRKFDVVYRYHDINDPIPDDTERSEIAAGRILHLSIAARIYGSPADAVTYADIAAGRYDVDLERQAAGIASLRTPVFMTFEQEANQHSKLGQRGTAAQFRSAWRHVHEVYDRAGATNAVWVWVMTGAAENLSRAGELWPGNDVVDWISWNVYNQSGCGSGTVTPDLFVSFADALAPFYTWVHGPGKALGIDAGKPMMISETGSVLYSGDPAMTAGWYAGIPAALADFPQVKAVAMWDSRTSPACDYTFQRDPAVLASVARAGVDPRVTGR